MEIAKTDQTRVHEDKETKKEINKSVNWMLKADWKKSFSIGS